MIPRKMWTKEDTALLIELYNSVDTKDGGWLDIVAEKLGRSRASVACKANALKITDMKRPVSEEGKEQIGIATKKSIKKYGHPKGHQGKKHGDKTKEKISGASKKYWERITPIDLEIRRIKGLATKKKNGTLNSMRGRSNPYSRTRSGKRTDLNDTFFRSRTEANYARYLNFMKVEWVFEPKDFYFDDVRRGCVSYTPDFYLPKEDRWVEVKGWFDPKSKTKLKRFKKYYPEEFKKLTIVTESYTKDTMAFLQGLCVPVVEQYRDIKQYARLIPGWEG